MTISSSLTSASLKPSFRTVARRRSIAISCAVLVIAMAVAGAGVAWWLSQGFGLLGVCAALLAAGLCLAASLAALLVSASFAGTSHAMSANLGKILIRMGAPLFGLVALPGLFPQLAAVGLANAVLVMYLVGLVVETLLAVRHVVPLGKGGGGLTSGVAAGAALASGERVEASSGV